MLLIGLCLGLLIIMIAVLFWLSEQGYDDLNTISGILAIILSVIAFVSMIIYIAQSFVWISAGYQKDIINKEFNKNYTQEDVYWAKDVIDEIRHLQRQRIEVDTKIKEE